MRLVLTLFVLVLGGACGGGGRGAGPVQPPRAEPQAQPSAVPASTAESSSSGANAVSRKGCGPADGPAIDIRIFDQVAGCADVETALLRANVGLWSGELPEPGTALNLDGVGGRAELCVHGGCRPVERAELVVSERHGEGWSGLLRWNDASGSHELSIRALECPSEPVRCG